MKKHFTDLILKATQASSLYEIETLQELWSGYGTISRYGLSNSPYNRIIVKHIQTGNKGKHPRGWNTDKSHQRKVRSYEVEKSWYEQWSSNCDQNCRIPACLAVDKFEGETLIVLEDLDDSGYPKRISTPSKLQILACLTWLANFHATFMGQKPTNLWKTGTYWHLKTRPDELKALEDEKLKDSAVLIDKLLRECSYQTFVHGDAKLANFCFPKKGKNVAAVDFQYVGGGCGMKDVAYFIGSCLYENECEQLESTLLNHYFNSLQVALREKESPLNFSDLEREWRRLYPVAWTDFHRFLKGWSPGHWKINSYSERLAREVISELKAS